MKSKDYFEPFGIELPPINSTDNRIKYTNQERDTFTNYDYMHFRFYASSMGRFLKPDNIIPDITNPQNWNAYTYVKGNPVNYNDPSGHFAGGFGGGITRQTMKQVCLPPPSGTGWERTMVQYMTFMITDFYNVLIAKDSDGKIVSVEGTYLYSQAGAFFSGSEIRAGRAGDAQSSVLSKDDPIWPMLKKALKLQDMLKVEIAYAIAKADGTILGFKWQAGKSATEWGTSAEFGAFVRKSRAEFILELKTEAFVMDVGHTHPENMSANFSPGEYRWFSNLAAFPYIDRVLVVKPGHASYYQ